MRSETIKYEKIKEIVKKYCDTDNFTTSYETITVDSANFYYSIPNSVIVMIVNETVDIPLTATMIIKSSDNFIVTSKVDFEENKPLEIEKFQNYIKIRLQNYGSFTPFKIKLLIITPY